MKISLVNDRRTRKIFLDTARTIYKADPVWVCPLDNDIESVFDPAKNPYYKHGEAERWILTDNGKPAGRIAAFIDYKSAGKNDQLTGGTGFFECINDREAAFMLFDTARDWLREKGMQAMDGPINFGETDRYWGLLVEGFTHPSYEVPYNPPYYQNFFESYGFMPYYTMEGFHVDVKQPFSDRYMRIATWLEKKGGYEFRHFTMKERDKYVADFVSVYNEAWASFKTNLEPIEAKYVQAVIDKARPILDEEFIWFAYYEGKPVAILFVIPDLNMILKHLNGKLNLFSALKFLYLKKRNVITRAKGLLMGVIPKFQGLGIESAFFLHFHRLLQRKSQYTEFEFSWVADFNPKMRRIFVSTGGVPAKKYITYRYLFDRKAEFKRYPIPDILNRGSKKMDQVS